MQNAWQGARGTYQQITYPLRQELQKRKQQKSQPQQQPEQRGTCSVCGKFVSLNPYNLNELGPSDPYGQLLRGVQNAAGQTFCEYHIPQTMKNPAQQIPGADVSEPAQQIPGADVSEVATSTAKPMEKPTKIPSIILQICNGDEEEAQDFLDSVEFSIIEKHKDNPEMLKNIKEKVQKDIDETAKALEIDG